MIYVDSLLAVNAVTSFLMLRITALITGARTHRLRTAGACALGAVFSLTILLPSLRPVAAGALQALSVAAASAVCYGVKPLKMYLKNTLWLAGVTFCFGGAVSAAVMLLPYYSVEKNNGVIYISVPPLVLLGALAAVYVMMRLITLIFSKPQPPGRLFAVRFGEGVTGECRALHDTGNRLFDPFSGRPVVVLSASCRLDTPYAEAVRDFYDGVYRKDTPKLRVIPATTARGKGVLVAFCCSGITIRAPDGSVTEISDVVVAVSHESFSECEALLSDEIFENG